MSLQSRITGRERPYSRDNQASLVRKMEKPRDLLAWFLAGYRAEVPSRLHARGVWGDQRAPSDDRDYEPVGGSLMGSPRSSDAFRAYLEWSEYDSPTELARLTDLGVTVADRAYRYPMRAALRSVAGRGPDSGPYPFMARFLFRTACLDGDWDRAAASMGITAPVRRVYRDAALDRLWTIYREEPPARPIREVSAA